MMGRMTRQLMMMPAHINAREDKALGNVPDMPMKGRGHDDRIAMLTPEQMAILKAMGGSGTMNPETGLRQFDWGDSSGDYGSYSDGGAASGNSGGETGGGMGDYNWQGDPAGENVASESFNASHAAMGPNAGPQEPAFTASPTAWATHQAAKYFNSPANVMGAIAPFPGANFLFSAIDAASRRWGNPNEQYSAFQGPNEGGGFSLANRLLDPTKRV